MEEVPEGRVGVTDKSPAPLKALIAIKLVFAFVGCMSGYGLLSSPLGEGLGLSPYQVKEGCNAPQSCACPDVTARGLSPGPS